MGQDSPNADVARPGLYRFDDIEVDAAAHTLKRGGEPKPLEPKAFAVLLALLQRPGALIGRDELLDGVWGHRHVTPGVLTRAIAQLRNALGDDSQHPRYIQTRHALGYCFVGELGAGLADVGRIAKQDEIDWPGAATDVPQTGVASAQQEVFGGRIRQAMGKRYGPLWFLLLAILLVAILVAYWGRKQVSSLAGDRSIAVLPFTSLSGEAGDQYFAQGLSVELLSALAELPQLKVAAWRPAEAVDRSLDVRTLGRQFGVATVLDAKVRREAGRLRISAMLSDVQSGYTLWSRTYDRRVDEALGIQAEIAREVAQTMLGTLPDAGMGLEKRLSPTEDAAAFDAYLKGLGSAMDRASPDSELAAENYFRTALQRDSGFARAQAGLCRTELKRYEGSRDPAAFENARLACLKAAEMDRGLGDVELALGDLYRAAGDTDQALEHYDKLANDNALRIPMLLGRARVFSDIGRMDRAMEQFELALRERPNDVGVLAEMGYRRYVAGDYQNAIRTFEKVTAISPENAGYLATYGGMLVAAGRNEEAEPILLRSIQLAPNASSFSNLGEIRYQAGRYDDAAGMFGQASRLDPTDFMYLGFLGDSLAAAGRSPEEVAQAYGEAEALASNYVRLKPVDALATASLAWYSANLGKREEALEHAAKAAELGGEPGEVAMLNAQTHALLGDMAGARKWMSIALGLGVPRSRIEASVTLRRFDIVDSPAITQ